MRHNSGGQQHNHGQQDDDGRRGAGSHRNGLAANKVRRIHDQHVGIGEALVQRLPCALQEQRVADLEFRLRRIERHIRAGDGENDEIAALRHHAGEGGGADQSGSRWDHHFGQA